MKKLVLFAILLSYSFLSANCDTAYSNATYALSHTKKGLKADNFDHQKYYAERALEAFNKTKEEIEKCGCTDALNSILDGIEDLESAIDPDDWDKGRYYTKGAYAKVQEAITAMDICSGATVTIDYDVDTASLDDNGSEIALESKKLNEQQKKLEEEQQKLLAQQEALAQKMEQQELLLAEANANRQIELESQLLLKNSAEISLLELQNTFKELALTLGCENALSSLSEINSRPDDALSTESLKETRAYYITQSKALQLQFTEALNKCYQNVK